MNSIWIDVANRGLMFAMLAVGANVLLGVAGQLSLATAAFFGIGSYTSAVLTADHGWGFLPATLAAIAVSSLLGAVLALPVRRVQGEYVVLLTLAFLSVVNRLESSWIDLTGGATGKFPIPGAWVFGLEPRTPWGFLPVNVVLLVIVVVVCLAVVESPYGRILKGLRDEPTALSAVGVNTFRTQLSVFALSVGVAGLVGSVWSAYFAFVAPTAFNLDQTIFIAAIVVLGGMGNLWGSVIAAFVLVAIPQMLKSVDLGADHSAQIQQIVYGAALVGFMLLRPQGLFRERVAERGGSDVGPVVGVSSREASAPLEARQVGKDFGGVRALDEVSIELAPGSITALIGPNGAGKTTLFKVLAGALAPDRGSVWMAERELTGLRVDQVVGHGVARSFQDVRLFGSMSALGNVAVGIGGQVGTTLRGILRHPVRTFRQRGVVLAEAGAILDRVGFVADRSCPVADLGYGEQKLVALARVLAVRPTIVLLDEPSSGTDSSWVALVVETIRDLAAAGTAVCIVEHNLDLIRELDGTAYLLDEARIVARGSVAELMGDRRLLETYLGIK